MTAPHLLPKFLRYLSHIFSELNPATQTILVIVPPSGFLSPAFYFLARMFDQIVVDYFWGMHVSVVMVASTVVPSFYIFLEMLRGSRPSFLVLIVFSVMGTWYCELDWILKICDDPRMASVDFALIKAVGKCDGHVTRPV